MNVRYDLEKIKSYIIDLCIVTDASMAVYDTDMRMIYVRQKKGDRFCHRLLGSTDGADKCRQSDLTLLKRCAETGLPQSHICHAGLLDTAVPIIKDSMIVGYLIIGRVRPSREFNEDVAKRLSWSDINTKELQDSYESLAYFTQEQLKSLVNLIISTFIDNAITVEYTDTLSAAVEYIDNNLHRQITVSELCAKCFVSKNQLYSAFRDNLGTTIKEYIVARKLEKAKQLLVDTDRPIVEISEAVAVGEYSYFCKLFKKKTGMTPKAFRERRYAVDANHA